MTKIISTTEHFQQFLTDPKGSSGVTWKPRPGWLGNGFWRPSRSGGRNQHMVYESYKHGPRPARPD